MTNNVWTVPAKVLRVVDADTLILLLDLGWHITYEARCRLVGVNAPEMGTDEGKAARAFVMDLLSYAGGVPSDGVPTEVTFVSHALDKYGRPLGQVLVTDQQGARLDLADVLLSAGHAVPMR